MKLQQLEVADSFVRLALSGKLDQAGSTQVEAAFQEATVTHGKHAIVDISQVTFISSLGIALLINRCKELSRRGARLVLLSPTRDVESVFSTAGLKKLLLIAHNDDEARQMLTAAK